MTLVRSTPRSIDREINMLVNNLWDGTRKMPRSAAWSPCVDIAELEDRFTILAELPGMTQNEISVTVENSVLTIKGEKKPPEADTAATEVRTERGYGSFHRSFKLGERVDVKGIEASYRDGVLHLSVPKAEIARPRSIDIKVS